MGIRLRKAGLYKTRIEYRSGYCDFEGIRSMCYAFRHVEVHFQLLSILRTEEVLGEFALFYVDDTTTD